MKVRIGQYKTGMWVAVSGNKIVAWDSTYSGVLMICNQRGWTVVR